MSADPFAAALGLTRRGLEESLRRHLPACAYQDYCLWMLRAEHAPRERWMDLMGLSQMVHLFMYLLKDVAREQDWRPLLEGVVPVNIYQMYEVVSDNLAIGLARPGAADTHHEARRRVLHAFNAAMVARLQGASEPATLGLAALQPDAAHVSLFAQSLNPAKHRELAELYLAQHPHVLPSALENAVWPCLVANIESCAALASLSAGSPVASLVRQGLIARYQGVNALLEEPDMPFERRVRIGADTILVVPMTGWYVGVLAELHQEPHIQALCQEGLLLEVLEDSALLLRLLNDLGTTLLVRPESERRSMLQPLREAASRHPTAPLDALLREVGPTSPVLSRILKDVEHGEFNVCLHGLMDAPASRSLEPFESRLADSARLYGQHRQRWEVNLGRLRERLTQDAIPHIIHRFVTFHEKLYTHRYSEQLGEYAV